ncbi:hypothetical protein DPEC_G00214130 [Dallia pectoralis]|uniref:Uncharacterized protein n=1 Tax=Dallia pectoralis TaxID=75939 RepID=A0ACC2G1Z5_DALPE|nr:hypothetical protein DPEC_G00214130 [Dallia pectoralis]
MASLLWSATNRTAHLRGNDVKTAYSVLARLLQYESQQLGFNMAATRDVQFHENIVRTGSAILDLTNREHWQQIQRSEGGTALLMHSFEEYAQTLAQNLRKIYLKPFTIVTENMMVSVVYLDPSKPEQTQVPGFHSFLANPKEMEASVRFPDFLAEQEQLKEEVKAFSMATSTDLPIGRATDDPITVTTEAPPLQTESPKAPPLQTESPKAPLLQTESPEAPPLQTESPEAPPLQTESPEAPPLQTESPEAPPLQTLSPDSYVEGHLASRRKRRHAKVPGPPPVAVVIIYRTLGRLLPENYDADRRSLRLPLRPVINSPIVSTVIYSEDLPLTNQLLQPVILEYKLQETDERTKPVCVYWNHTISIRGTGGWSARGCELVSRNSSHISCRCGHMSSFAVLMDVSNREHGEVLPLKIITYTTVSASLVALLITFLLLAILRKLRSNLHSIHKNLVVSIFLSELIFMFGINQTGNAFLCTMVALLLHYSYMCTFAWMFVEGLHIYRMLTDIRNVNHGHMRFYYAIGWGIPAIITGLAVGLDPQGYGNLHFCWLSVHDTLIWSIAGPIGSVVLVNITLFFLAAKASCGKRQLTFEKSGAICSLRASFLLLVLLSATWLLCLMAVNSDILSFHYLFAVFSCLQGVCIFFFHCVFNEEVRTNLKNVFMGKKPLLENSTANHCTLLTRSLNGKPTRPDEDARRGTTQDRRGLPPTGLDKKGSHGEGDSSVFIRKRSKRDDSDSDSELSLDEDSRSCASLDSENGRRRSRQRWSNERQPQHSTPKASESEELRGMETLRVETRDMALRQDNKDNTSQSDSATPSSPDSNLTEKRRGILKNKITYPPPLVDKNIKNLLQEKLSHYDPSTISQRVPPPVPSSPRLHPITGANGVLVKHPPRLQTPQRPPLSPRDPRNGVAVTTTRTTAPVDGFQDPSDSDGSSETSI